MKRLPGPLAEGRPEPFGAQVVDGGVNFAVWSEHATRIELCLFDEQGGEAGGEQRVDLHGPFEGVFHGLLPGAGPGLVYAYRAHGPNCPQAGHRFDPSRPLLDPYAREIVSGPGASLLGRVAAPVPAPGTPRPRPSPGEVVLCELHVKGFTRLHPEIPEALRGTYAGLAHPASIAHFKRLGVTTLSLLPVFHWLDEPHLVARGLTNHWGYNTIGFFAASPRLCTRAEDPSCANAEFRAMVEELHRHGLQVVLDVVFNHTAEGGDGGPVLSFRGLDNASWYRLDGEGRCVNFTGCGNTVNVAHPRVTQFVLDSLRWWVEGMGVDGFRFDLAPVLGRGREGRFEPDGAFFTALRQDPVLSRVHLIAEPWDAAPDGYQVGRFPGRFLEWNDRFRDAVRGWWLGRPVTRGELARRFAGSSDLFGEGTRRPTASVNFVSVHDGFTLADVVSYSRKHNIANGEDNRDGRDDELSDNLGTEGPTADAAIAQRRRRAQSAMLATLLLAQGTPMLCAGDEIGNSQQGNNNAYCQDNPTGWLDWASADEGLQGLVERLLALRREEPLLKHDRWFVPGRGPRLRWLSAQGAELQGADWEDPHERSFAAWLDEGLDDGKGAAGAGIIVAFNGLSEPQSFALPAGLWQMALESSGESSGPQAGILLLPACAVAVLRREIIKET